MPMLMLMLMLMLMFMPMLMLMLMLKSIVYSVREQPKVLELSILVLNSCNIFTNTLFVR
jgi:hypothetical protein